MQRLAEATWRVIVEHGIRAVSVRTVAGEAGMAVGSLRHLFPTQATLLEFSAELMLQRAAARVTAIASLPSDDVITQAMRVITELMPTARVTRREFEINLALIAETPTTPGLAEIRDRSHSELLDLFTRIVASIKGEEQPSVSSIDRGTRLLALVDGLGLHLLHQPVESDSDWALSIIREELDQLGR